MRTEFTISVVDERFKVTGIDADDGEEFKIYDVGYDGESIHFTSLMPSTGRMCRFWIRPVELDKVSVRCTFTDHELWVRKSPNMRVLPRSEDENAAS